MIQQMTIIFDDAHTDSMKNLAKVARDNWPILYLKIEPQGLRYNFGMDIVHKCTECQNTVMKAALQISEEFAEQPAIGGSNVE